MCRFYMMLFGVKNSNKMDGKAEFIYIFSSSISFCKSFAVDCQQTKITDSEI